MGVLEEKGERNSLPLFTKSVATLGITIERSDTPPILMVVLRVIGTSLRRGIDCHTRYGKVAHCTDVTGLGKWSPL